MQPSSGMVQSIRTFMLAGTVALIWAGGAALAQKVPPPKQITNPNVLSAGAKTWWYANLGQLKNVQRAPFLSPAKSSFGSNVDAANPSEDLGAGQSETAIAATGNLVMAAWNDATGFFATACTPGGANLQASLTGVGFSTNGGASFTDLVGLPNPDCNQAWFGDPSVVAVDNGAAFIVSSLYLPSFTFTCPGVFFEITVSVATVGGSTVTFTNPITAVSSTDLCTTFADFLDKPFMAYDSPTRTLVISYTRFRAFPGFGTGQIEAVEAQVPADPSTLSSANFSAPSIIWAEEKTVFNQGSYPALATTASFPADFYVVWERNWISNLFNGDPFVFIHAACAIGGLDTTTCAGSTADPIVVTQGQVNSTAAGGVKSTDLVVIAGYNRGLGNDFPRIAFDGPLNQVIVEWNDASLHPLADIWMRAFPSHLGTPGPISKVNTDDSGALHFLPAVCAASDGSIVSSWYDRRRGGADSTSTDYFAETRPNPTTNRIDHPVTTGSTDWNATSSIIIPNFGDYTNNTCTTSANGKPLAYYNWSDGRTGVPQPFVDDRTH